MRGIILLSWIASFFAMTETTKPSRRSIWDAWEDIAARYLSEKWLQIIERNYQIKWGEIDIIARDGDFFVFVEVRYRRDESHGHPLDTFGVMKRRALKRTAFMYVHKYKIDPDMMRIDFVGIMPKSEWGHKVWWVRGVGV
jgi:putative endonuclease